MCNDASRNATEGGRTVDKHVVQPLERVFLNEGRDNEFSMTITREYLTQHAAEPSTGVRLTGTSRAEADGGSARGPARTRSERPRGEAWRRRHVLIPEFVEAREGTRDEKGRGYPSSRLLPASYEESVPYERQRVNAPVLPHLLAVSCDGNSAPETASFLNFSHATETPRPPLHKVSNVRSCVGDGEFHFFFFLSFYRGKRAPAESHRRTAGTERERDKSTRRQSFSPPADMTRRPTRARTGSRGPRDETRLGSSTRFLERGHVSREMWPRDGPPRGINAAAPSRGRPARISPRPRRSAPVNSPRKGKRDHNSVYLRPDRCCF